MRRAYFSADVSQLFRRRTSVLKLYANVIMLGIAFQRGELPLSLKSLEYGIQETMGSAATENWIAFKLGRKIAHDALTASAPVAASEGSYQESSRGETLPGCNGQRSAMAKSSRSNTGSL